MRMVIYGTMALLAGLLLTDTNFGTPLDDNMKTDVERAIIHLEARQFIDDAELARSIMEADGYRTSWFFSTLTRMSQENGHDFAFYAYTPILSTSRVFLGEDFWSVGTVGRASVLVHEFAHVNRHSRRLLRGFPRHEDEAEAYLTQYLTHRPLGLTPNTDGLVYWDMMLGVKTYVLPVSPELRERRDIVRALRMMGEEAN